MKNTIFVAGDGGAQVSSGDIAGIYTTGNLNINSSATLNLNNNKDTVISILGIGSNGSATAATAKIQDGSWKSL